ncbi:hypothetical protein RU07_16045 [Agrobacterium tumefaciens]|uniref:Uncharacterized protein n=1 Tax=Agrobacterium tumefaciens TaxID=358 RepID=A0A0D0KSD8_AGRTU|nr:hypothetical protein RU07_16045 [Agrobacterium tumefaciens]
MLFANLFDPFKQMRGPFSKPDKRILADLEMLRVPGLHIGLVDRVEPSPLPMLVAQKSFDQTQVLLLSKRTQNLMLWEAGP